MKKFCDGKCNSCVLLSNSNAKILTVIFNKMYDKFGDDAYFIVQNECPNLTCCYDCGIDDFCHIEGCESIDAEKDE